MGNYAEFIEIWVDTYCNANNKEMTPEDRKEAISDIEEKLSERYGHDQEVDPVKMAEIVNSEVEKFF